MNGPKRWALGASLLVLIATSYASAAGVTGFVFEDANRNRKMDATELGIAGVAVSDGVQVVQTNSTGSYSLNVDGDAVIFVTKPSGYMTPVNTDNVPQFFYIHQPKGSPAFEYKGVAPTGELPKQIDFAMYKVVESDAFDVLVTSDPQVRTAEEVGYVRDDVVAELVGKKASFCMALGDIMFDFPIFYERYNQVMGEIGVPVYTTPGNHDMNFDSTTDADSLETYKSVYGPTYFSYNYGKVHFVSMDSIGYLGSKKYEGRFGDKQLEWLKNDLAFVSADSLVVLSMHIPLSSINDREKLFDIVKGRQHLLTLAGHTHTLVNAPSLTGAEGWNHPQPFPQVIVSTVAGQWWRGPKDGRGIPVSDQRDGTPNGYHTFSFDGNKFTQTFKAAGMAPDYQVRISSPDGIILSDRFGYVGSNLITLQIVANVFNGNDLSTVTAQFNNEAPTAMVRKVMLDPFIVDSFARGYEKQAAVNSQHVWVAPLPASIAPGAHHVTVTTTDQYGRTYKTSKVFEVQTPAK